MQCNASRVLLTGWISGQFPCTFSGASFRAVTIMKECNTPAFQGLSRQQIPDALSRFGPMYQQQNSEMSRMIKRRTSNQQFSILHCKTHGPHQKQRAPDEMLGCNHAKGKELKRTGAASASAHVNFRRLNEHHGDNCQGRTWVAGQRRTRLVDMSIQSDAVAVLHEISPDVRVEPERVMHKVQPVWCLLPDDLVPSPVEILCVTFEVELVRHARRLSEFDLQGG